MLYLMISFLVIPLSLRYFIACPSIGFFLSIFSSKADLNSSGNNKDECDSCSSSLCASSPCCCCCYTYTDKLSGEMSAI